MKHNGRTYFISGHHSQNTFSQNLDNDVKLLSKLRKLGYDAVMCTGCYEGRIEFSYMKSVVELFFYDFDELALRL